MILDLIEEINGLVILIEGESLCDEQIEDLKESPVEDLKERLTTLKMKLHGF